MLHGETPETQAEILSAAAVETAATPSPYADRAAGGGFSHRG